MPVLVPDLSEATLIQQSRLDSRDLAIFEAGGANYGVASGGVVTAQGTPDGTVALPAYSLVFSPPGASQINISTPAQNANVLTGAGSLASDATNPRIDLVVINSSGVVSVLHGTAAAVTATSGPVYPTRAAIGVDSNGIINQIVVARIDVRAASTTIITSDIIDKRFFPQPPVVPPVAGVNATVVYPGQLTQALVTAAGVGACFVLKAGTHQSVAITPLNSQTFIGEPGAIMDGGMITRSFAATAGTTGTTLVATGGAFTSADVSALGATPTYISGLSWSNVASAAYITALTNGTTVTTSLTVSTTNSPSPEVAGPVGRIVTLTRAPAAGIEAAFTGNAANVTIKNIIIQNYASQVANAAIHPVSGGVLADNWIVEDCEIKTNAMIGIRGCDNMLIRHCRIHHNGDIGAGGAGTNIELVSNEIYNNNAYNNDVWFDAAGVKFALTTGLHAHHNRIHDNAAIGLWCDVQCFGTVIEYNRIWSNANAGIQYETSYNAKIRYNTLYGNGIANSSNGFDPGNIFLAAVANVEVHDNIVGKVAVGNYHGITMMAQDRFKISNGPQHNVTCTIADATVNGFAVSTLTPTSGSFTQADRNAIITGTGIATASASTFAGGSPGATTIASITAAGVATTTARCTAASGIVVAVTGQYDQFGSILGSNTPGGSGWYQRMYNVEVHHNYITTTTVGQCDLAGMVSDIANAVAAGYYTTRGIRFHSNTYNFAPGGDRFNWNGSEGLTTAQWQALGMDAYENQLAPTSYVPTTETILAGSDPLGIQRSLDDLSTTQVTNITGAVTIDLSLGSHQRLTLTGNVTSLAVSNVPPAGPVVIEFIQDGTGSRTRVNTGTNIKPAGAALGTQTATASKRDIYVFSADGTSIYEISRSLNI